MDCVTPVDLDLTIMSPPGLVSLAAARVFAVGDGMGEGRIVLL